jgi:hypothetical protein
MDRRWIIVFMILAVFLAGAVSAADNSTDTSLEKTYFYNDETGEKILDDTVETHNIVKYYGDEDTKFKVKVYDEDYNPEKGVYVSFGKDWDHLKEKETNKNGNVYFPINYKVGKHSVMTYIECADYDDGTPNLNYFLAKNKVTVKTTIVSKTLKKYTTQKDKAFKIKFLNTKGKPLSYVKVTFKVKAKSFKVKTDGKGFAKIRLNWLKSGKYRMEAYNPASKEKRKISVYIYKKGEVNTATLKVSKSDYFPTKRLKTGDFAWTVYEWKKNRQYAPGVYVELGHSDGGLDLPAHTKLLKVKFYFKNKNGHVATKTSTNVHYECVKVHQINGYTPYKAKIWYKTK